MLAFLNNDTQFLFFFFPCFSQLPNEKSEVVFVVLSLSCCCYIWWVLPECSDGNVVFWFGNASEVKTTDEKETTNRDGGRQPPLPLFPFFFLITFFSLYIYIFNIFIIFLIKYSTGHVFIGLTWQSNDLSQVSGQKLTLRNKLSFSPTT